MFVELDAARENMFQFVREMDDNVMNVYDVYVALVVARPYFH